MKKSTIASLVGLTLSTPIHANEIISLDDVTVKANRFERKDTETTYASEIHTAAQIEASGAATLYEYLAQQTSLNASPNIGNRATPAINLRGFGTENGHQNVVITIDGQRLNSIDLSPSLLAGIALGNIDRIEIAKGSGSVIYGDGATAGAVQIYTKNKTGVTASTSLGNFGQKNSYINAGFSEKHIDLSVNLAHDSHDGFSKKDITGHKDQFTSNSQNVKLKIKSTDDLRFNIEGTSSRNDVRYINPMSKQQFRQNPRQDPRNLDWLNNIIPYTQQSFDSDQWSAGAEYDISSKLKIKATHFREDKRSAYITYNSEFNYDNEANALELTYSGDNLNVIGGVQTYDGDRKASTNVTSKDNRAIFIQTEYVPSWISDKLTLSAGARGEEIKYQYKPVFGSNLKDSKRQNAWDVGANYRINSQLSIFANYNKAFQSPDIDRFFRFDTTTFETVFDGFIKPAEIKTFNLGLNHVIRNNRLKASVFYSKINNEIYLDPTFIDPVFFFSGRNANADKTHKYGFELQDFYKITDNLGASLIYNYTRAIIDKEIGFDGSEIHNKDLPGVPKHTAIANLNYKFLDHAALNINHTWRSKAYAFNDFQNNFSQKQDSYNSTNIAINYQYRNLNFFTSINNIFDQENSIQVADDAIYPVDFERTWRIGMKADF